MRRNASPDRPAQPGAGAGQGAHPPGPPRDPPGTPPGPPRDPPRGPPPGPPPDPPTPPGGEKCKFRPGGSQIHADRYVHTPPQIYQNQGLIKYRGGGVPGGPREGGSRGGTLPGGGVPGGPPFRGSRGRGGPGGAPGAGPRTLPTGRRRNLRERATDLPIEQALSFVKNNKKQKKKNKDKKM